MNRRVARFKEDYISLRKQYERIKKEGTSTVSQLSSLPSLFST